MINNIQTGQPLVANLDPSHIAKAAAVGAVTGAVGGLTFRVGLAAGSAIAGAVGISAGSGVAASLAGGITVAASGVLAGQTSKATANVLTGQPIDDDLFNPRDMAFDATISLIGFRFSGARFDAIPRVKLSGGEGLGPFGVKTVNATSPSSKDTTRGQKALINEYGRKYGCHTCGTKNPGGSGTSAGRWVGDHLKKSNSTRMAPQCNPCSNSQGGYTRWGTSAWLPNHIWSGRWWMVPYWPYSWWYKYASDTWSNTRWR